jgi:hypothetical protein
VGELLYMPRNEQLTEEQFIQNPYVGLQTLSFSIKDDQHSIQLVKKPFEANGDVRPIHCRKALNVLEKLNENIKTICRLLPEAGSTVLGPTSTVTFHSSYQLLNTLFHIQERIMLLINLMDEYRLDCLTASRRLGQKRRVIQDHFSILWDNLASLLDQLESSDEVGLT